MAHLRVFRATLHLLLATILAASMRAQATQRPDSIPADSAHAAVAAYLERIITSEMRDKSLPALSVSLVEGGRIVWARGFGEADPVKHVPATAETVYRVGSVSKLFTDIGIMQLVEHERVSLDVPVSHYLPGFHPANPFGTPVTLRELTSHRAGLVREPPVGHYFDTTSPPISATVASLNQTTLLYRPATHIKYSNAGIAVVGDVLQHMGCEPFAAYLSSHVLTPLGMDESAFELTPALAPRVAVGYMWTY
ncbi:MAG: beta-lactamase family protein, partial [Gemmatimonadota bacterium]|nr:beta-lactamase family protein [Gemmatimonadota bacterium]